MYGLAKLPRGDEMNRKIPVVILLMIFFFSLQAFAEDAETSDEIASKYLEDVKAEQPFGALGASLQKVDELNAKGEYKEALQLSLMLTVRYWKERPPLLKRCAYSLAEMGMWEQCAQAYQSIADAALDSEVLCATEEYLYDAMTNLAFLYSSGGDSVSKKGMENLELAAEKASVILKDYPNGKFRIVEKDIGWRHPEASLALASASKALLARKGLERVIFLKREMGRLDVDTAEFTPYGYLALSQWWGLVRRPGTQPRDILRVLKRSASWRAIPLVRAASYRMLGRLYETDYGNPKKAAAYYRKALRFRIVGYDHVWQGERERIQKALERLEMPQE